MAEARTDKWIWAVRIFKTCTTVTEVRKMNRVIIDEVYVKISRVIKSGDVAQVKKPPIAYSFRVLQVIRKRVDTKLVPDVMENAITPGQYELLEMSKISGFIDRVRGTGRLTKKDRRSLEEFTVPEFMNGFGFGFDSDEDK